VLDDPGGLHRKCDWKAAFIRVDLIATHGADYPLPGLALLFGGARLSQNPTPLGSVRRELCQTDRMITL
jgi:hypothetical protein